MDIKKRVALPLLVYGFLAYVVMANIKPSLPFPAWAAGLYFALGAGICILVYIKKELWGLMVLGFIGFVAVAYFVTLLLM